MKRLLLLAGLLSAGPACVASPVVRPYIVQDSAAGTFEVRLDASLGDPHGGIASYGVMLSPRAGTTVLSLDHSSPRQFISGLTPETSGAWGFTLLRTADGPANLLLGGSQDTISPTPHLIYGYGVVAGPVGLLPQYFPNPIPSWGPRPVIASGTYVPGGWLEVDFGDINTFVNVFQTESGSATTWAVVAAPEPAAVGVAATGLAFVGAAGRRRRLLPAKRPSGPAA